MKQVGRYMLHQVSCVKQGKSLPRNKSGFDAAILEVLTWPDVRAVGVLQCCHNTHVLKDVRGCF